MAEYPALRVIVIDPHELFADAIKTLLEREGLVVAGTAASGGEAISLMESEDFNLVLLDLQLPDTDGINLGKRILREWPAVKVIAITPLSDPDAAQQALRAGLHGYATKHSPGAHLMVAIQAAVLGQATIPHHVAAAVAGGSSSDVEYAAMRADRLTRQERRVLSLLAEGGNSKDISITLGVTRDTLRTHIQNVLSKLEVHSRLEAVAFAMRHGVIQPRARSQNVEELPHPGHAGTERHS
jgi:two-component system, NarL family, response regulator LiaR